MKYLLVLLLSVLGIVELAVRIASVPCSMFVVLMFFEDQLFECQCWKLAFRVLER